MVPEGPKHSPISSVKQERGGWKAGLPPHQHERRAAAVSACRLMLCCVLRALYLPEENEVSRLRVLERQIRNANEYATTSCDCSWSIEFSKAFILGQRMEP